MRQVREVVVYAKERCLGMKIIPPLCIAMVVLALGSLFHVSSTEPVHGLRMLQGIKATPTSGATQTINIDKTEFVHARSTDLCSMTTPLLAQTTAIHRTPGAPDERKSR